MATIRATAADDVPRILALIAEIFREYDCVLDTEREDPHLLDPGPYFRAQGGDFWVVEEAGEIIATVALALHEDAGELRCLYIHPKFRRQGWGRRLSDMTVDLARQAGKKRLILWSDTRFSAAHQLYHSMGFTQRGTRDLHDSNHTIEYGFELKL